MDTALATTIVSTGGTVIVSLSVLYFQSRQMGKRVDQFGKRLDDLRLDSDLGFDLKGARTELSALKDLMSQRLDALRLQIIKLGEQRQ